MVLLVVVAVHKGDMKAREGLPLADEAVDSIPVDVLAVGDGEVKSNRSGGD